MADPGPGGAVILQAVLAGVLIGYLSLGGSIVLVIVAGKRLGLWKELPE